MIQKIALFFLCFIIFGSLGVTAFTGNTTGEFPPLDGSQQLPPPNQLQPEIDLEEISEIDVNTDNIFKLGVTELENISYKNSKGEWEGFDIDVFDLIATDIGLEYEIVEYDSIDNILVSIENEETDFGIGLITMSTDKLKQGLQFSYPYSNGGASIIINNSSTTYTPNIFNIFFSWYIWKTIIISVLVIFLVGNIFHFVVDRRKKGKWLKNKDLTLFYTPQIFKAVWFASVKNGLSHIDVASTKNHHPISKFVVIPIWIFGFIVTSLITGHIVADITSERLIVEIDNNNLSNKKIAVLKDSDFYNILENSDSLGKSYVVEDFEEAINSIISGDAYGMIADDLFIDIAQSRLENYGIDTYKIKENLSEDYYGIAMNKKIVHIFPLVYLKLDFAILEKIESLEIKKIKDYWTNK